jgi:hypothetical protein
VVAAIGGTVAQNSRRPEVAEREFRAKKKIPTPSTIYIAPLLCGAIYNNCGGHGELCNNEHIQNYKANFNAVILRYEVGTSITNYDGNKKIYMFGPFIRTSSAYKHSNYKTFLE